MLEHFIWGDLHTREYGVYIFPVITDVSPARVYETETIPGRNGKLLIDTKRYENVSQSYYAVATTFHPLEELREALLSKVGYDRLEDSVNGGEFYLATQVGDLEIETVPERDLSRMRVTFERRPERYLKSGEQVLSFTQNGYLFNPTRFEAKPILRIYGDGYVEVGPVRVTTDGVDGYVDLDCESMMAYKGTVLQNSKVTVSGLYMPSLPAGKTGISLSGVTVDVTPRWWRL